MPKIFGKWKCNEVLDLSGFSAEYTEPVNFVMQALDVDGVGSDLSQYYTCSAAVFEIENLNSGGVAKYFSALRTDTNTVKKFYAKTPSKDTWMSSDYEHYMDFGGTEQEVTEVFYNWLAANATPTGDYSVSGKYDFNDTLKLPNASINQDVNFTFQDSDGVAHNGTSMTVYRYDGEYSLTGLYWNLPNESNLFLAAGLGEDSSQETWESKYGTACQHIDFGTEQAVSGEFYMWLINNATAVEPVEPEPDEPVDPEPDEPVDPEPDEPVDPEPEPEPNMVINITQNGKKTLATADRYCESDIDIFVDVPTFEAELAEADKIFARQTSVLNLPNARYVGLYAFSYWNFAESYYGNPRVYGAVDLGEANIPNVVAIFDSGFRECKKLAVVNAPNVTHVFPNAFNRCYALASIDLPKAVNLYGRSFSECSALSKVVLRGEVDVWLQNTSVFVDTPIAAGTGYIYVPDNLVDTYKNKTNWTVYADQIKPLSELEE